MFGKFSNKSAWFATVIFSKAIHTEHEFVVMLEETNCTEMNSNSFNFLQELLITAWCESALNSAAYVNWGDQIGCQEAQSANSRTWGRELQHFVPRRKRLLSVSLEKRKEKENVIRERIRNCDARRKNTSHWYVENRILFPSQQVRLRTHTPEAYALISNMMFTQQEYEDLLRLYNKIGGKENSEELYEEVSHFLIGENLFVTCTVDNTLVHLVAIRNWLCASCCCFHLRMLSCFVVQRPKRYLRFLHWGVCQVANYRHFSVLARLLVNGSIQTETCGGSGSRRTCPTRRRSSSEGCFPSPGRTGDNQESYQVIVRRAFFFCLFVGTEPGTPGALPWIQDSSWCTKWKALSKTR